MVVGPTDQCGWLWGQHGKILECNRDDEVSQYHDTRTFVCSSNVQVVVGRCGSGANYDCPEHSSHGILCCGLDYM